MQQAAAALAGRPQFARLPLDAQDMVTEMLLAAKGGDARSAMKIAASIDDLFAPGIDVSALGYKLRDDYTSLMWLGGTKALDRKRVEEGKRGSVRVDSGGRSSYEKK